MISISTKSLSKTKFFLIVLTCLVSYGQTLLMYFWQDDSALIFKLQHQAERMGSFGIGLWERGPYQYLVVPFVPFFPIFGKEPVGYFFIGLITYIAAALSFYFLSLQIFKKSNFALLASVIFSAGYVGSDTMFRIINSWQTNIGLILTIISFAFYLKYKNLSKFRYYLLSLLFFFLSIELVFIRSHSIVLPIIAVEILYTLMPIKLNKILSSIIKLLPFLFLFEKWYLQDANFGGGGISAFISNLLHGHLESTVPLFANIGNALVVTPVQNYAIVLLGYLHLGEYKTLVAISTAATFFSYLLFRLLKIKMTIFVLFVLIQIASFIFNLYIYSQNFYWYRSLSDLVSGEIGIYISILTFFLAACTYKKNKVVSLSLISGWIIVASQIFGYFTQYPTAIFPTAHRYFSYSFIGYSIWWAAVAMLLIKIKFKKLSTGLLVAIVLVLSNLWLSVRYQHNLVVNRSIPTRQFYKSLLSYYPHISKGSAFYFDIQSDSDINKQFADFFSVGSMPETTALGMYYDLDRYDIWMTTSADEMISRLSQEGQDLNKTYTFFYGDQGLIDTTKQFRASISGQAKSFTPITPLQINFEAKATLLEPKTYPSRYGKGEAYPISQVEDISDFLIQQQRFGQITSVTSDSEWHGREIENIIDSDTNTVWQGHRIYWGDTGNDNLYIDLKSIKTINTIFWQNWRETLTPISYDVLVSQDNKNWQQVYHADEDKKTYEQWTTISFPPVDIRFINMKITETETDDSPAITEIFAGEFKTPVDPRIALYFKQKPSFQINNNGEWLRFKKVANSFFSILASWKTDKNDKYHQDTNIAASIDGNWQKYEIVLPSGGTQLSDINFSTNIESNLEVKNIQMKNLTLEELDQKGLIKRFSEN